MRPSAIEKKRVRTSFGEIAYVEAGQAGRPPVLFVHGIPTSSYLWRDVLRFLQDDVHAFAPDLMGCGDTDVDPTRTPLHMDAQAEMLVEFMEAVGHRTFAVVAHDQGGAAAQILAARMPERLTALVLTDCVAYDNWPVPLIARMQQLARVPVLPDLVGRLGLLEWFEARSPFSNMRRGVFDRTRMTAESVREYLRPLRGTPAERARFQAFLLAGHPRYTELAVEGLRRFDRPTLVIWAGDDRFLSPSWGRRLQEDIPGAQRFELVPFCGHFWQEERPAEFASLMLEFFLEHLVRAPVADATARRLDETDAPVVRLEAAAVPR